MFWISTFRMIFYAISIHMYVGGFGSGRWCSSVLAASLLLCGVRSLVGVCCVVLCYVVLCAVLFLMSRWGAGVCLSSSSSRRGFHRCLLFFFLRFVLYCTVLYCIAFLPSLFCSNHFFADVLCVVCCRCVRWIGLGRVGLGWGGINRQVDAGADFVITQFFYDTEAFLSYVKRCRAVGITCPIIPGIMAIQVCAFFSCSLLLKRRYIRT